MVKKKLTKSAQVRALLNIGKTTEYIVKKVGCTKTLVYQVRRKINGDYVDAIVEAAHTNRGKVPVDNFPKVGDNPIPEFLQAKFALCLEDEINHPLHYKRNGIEAVDVIEAFELNYRLGNVVKYVLRHVCKGGVNDLKKAQWYLNREISKHE
jgi:hypothetical protein